MAPQPVLVDTGPLASWFDRGDGAHARCRSFFAAPTVLWMVAREGTQRVETLYSVELATYADTTRPK